MLWYVVPLTTVQKKHYKIIYNNQLWFKYQPRTKHTQNNTQQSTVESVAKDCMVHIVTYSVLVGTIAIMLCGWGYIWHTQQFRVCIVQSLYVHAPIATKAHVQVAFDGLLLRGVHF